MLNNVIGFLSQAKKKKEKKITLIVDSEYTVYLKVYFEVHISLYNTKTQYNAVIHTIKGLHSCYFLDETYVKLKANISISITC